MIEFRNKIPPPIVAAIFGLGMWSLTFFVPDIELLSLSFTVRLSLEIAFILAGAFFCLAGVVSFRMAKTTVNPLRPDQASSLVTSGIYRITRNPMYLGFTLFLAAWSLYLDDIITLTGVIGYMIYMQVFQIIPEEAALIKIFGSEFGDYQKRVRPWL